MLTIRNGLLEPDGEMEHTENFNRLVDRISLVEGKVKFFNKLPLDVINFPEVIYNYGGNADIPVYTGTETFAVEKNTGDTVDYNIVIGGTAKALTAETKKELFGEMARQTHAAVVLIQLPTNVPEDVMYGDSVLTSGDIEVIDGVPYLAYVLGMYLATPDQPESIEVSTPSFTLTYGGATYKIGWVWYTSDLRLEVAEA